MAKWIGDAQQPWQTVRPGLTRGVSGKLLLDGSTRIVLTRVAPGGMFRAHRDRYGHVFHILSGRGVAQVEAGEYPLAAGMTLQIEAGELHSYENHGDEDLLLISVNLPEASRN